MLANDWYRIRVNLKLLSQPLAYLPGVAIVGRLSESVYKNTIFAFELDDKPARLSASPDKQTLVALGCKRLHVTLVVGIHMQRRPKLSAPAHGTPRLQPRRSCRVSAWRASYSITELRALSACVHSQGRQRRNARSPRSSGSGISRKETCVS